MKSSILAAVAVSTALSACMTPPAEEPREHPIESAHLGLQPTAVTAPDETWWRAFGDPQLDRVMAQALAQSPSLAQAMARVRQAQSLADAAHAGQLPAVSFNATETRQRFSGKDVIPPPLAGGVHWEGREGLDLSWDLDFWGRQSSLVRQARAQTAAAGLDLASARLALSGAVTQAYIDLSRQHSLAEIADRAEAQRRRILDITRERVRAGLDTNVELREAEGAVPEARVEKTQARSAVALATHQLAALAGRGADAYPEIGPPQLDLEAVLPLPGTLPADLLGRRPDVLAARTRIDAAGAGREAAKAAYYPDINLTAFAGTAAIGFTTLFQGASGSYGVGPAIHLPLFDAGRLDAQFRGANAEIDSAVAAYNDTVVQAVRQSADQLSLIESLGSELAEQEKSLAAAESAYTLALERYRAGLSSYLTVLNAETQVLGARRERVQLASAQAIARVSLLLALGGSFNPENPHDH